MSCGKNDIINRLGGKVQYEMTVIDFAERLIKDSSLKRIYGNFDVDSLAGLLHDLLRAVLFEEEDTQGESRAKREAKLVLHHFRLFQLGLNGTHFDTIRNHFRDALFHSWVEEEIVCEATSYLDSIWPLFESQALDHQNVCWRKKMDAKATYKHSDTRQTPSLAQVDILTKNTMAPRTA